MNALPDQLDGTAPQVVVATSVDDDVALRESRGDVQAALATLTKTEREVLDLAPETLDVGHRHPLRRSRRVNRPSCLYGGVASTPFIERQFAVKRAEDLSVRPE